MKTAKMVAPFSPFLAEDIFQNLRTSSDEESIHLSEYPRSNPDRIDRELEFKMDISRHVVEITRSLRNDTQIKVRQPLSRIVVAVKNEKQKQAIELMDGIIREEINVKKIEVIFDANSLIIKKLKPNFKTLGPKFGKSVTSAAEAIKNMTGEDILKLEQKGKFEIFVDGHEKPIGLEEVEIVTESQPGFAASSDGDLTLALDTSLTEELIHEGFAREFVNRVQNMRKEADYQVTDRIQIFCETSPRLQNALQLQLDYIMQETLAIDVQFHLQNGGVHQEWDINNEPAKIMIARAQ
jgi:isoleucyl-tRNA synthetase